MRTVALDGLVDFFDGIGALIRQTESARHACVVLDLDPGGQCALRDRFNRQAGQGCNSTGLSPQNLDQKP
jgi:hypothetical protein